MIWTGGNTTRTKIYNKDIFCDNNFNNKKTIFVTLVDHGQKLMGQKKVAQTLIIYPALRKSEKRYKGENVTQKVWDVARPRRPTSYIYIVPSEINSFSF